MCVVLFLAHVCWQCSVLGLRVSSFSFNCIGVASGSGTEVGGAASVNLAVLGFGHNGAPVVCSVAEHGNQHTPLCFSNLAAFGSFTHDLKITTRAWQHRLTTWTEHESIALLRCFTNAHHGKTSVCLIVSD